MEQQNQNQEFQPGQSHPTNWNQQSGQSHPTNWNQQSGQSHPTSQNQKFGQNHPIIQNQKSGQSHPTNWNQQSGQSHPTSQNQKSGQSRQSKRNYQKELEALIAKHQQSGEVPALFLHSCCAPCSSYVLEYLSEYFKITVFYYNPNIYPEEEYRKRVSEQQSFIESFPARYPIRFVEGAYDKERFYEMAKGLEQEPEGGERCFGCYRLRLREAAAYARELGMDYFTTTLSISPLKSADKLNEIGLALAEEYGVAYLVSDFKKKNGYHRSVELSKEYGMYRQDYCGCVFSQKERERKRNGTRSAAIVQTGC